LLFFDSIPTGKMESLSWNTVGFFVGISAALVYALRARKSTKKKNELTNPQCQGINRLHSHVVLSGFNSEKEARSQVCDPKCSPFSKVLSGTWKLSIFSDIDSALAAVGTYSGPNTVAVAVPGNWQLQVNGGDGSVYSHQQCPFPVNPPHIPRHNPCGYYRQNFTLSNALVDRRIILHFGGVESAFYVWLNREFVGFSKDSKLSSGEQLQFLMYTDWKVIFKCRI
jgi:beta-galactosidase